MKKRNTESRSRGGRREGRKAKIVRTPSSGLAGMVDRSDWERADALPDPDIEQAIADDPDAAPVL